jgi:4-phytase/acid phosphatase
MSLFKRVVVLLGIVLALTFIPFGVQVLAQTIGNANDGTTLKQIIIFGRHSIRSSIVDPSILARFSVDPYPPFEVQPGYLTPHGRQAEILLGAYYRQYLLSQGLLTGNDQTDAARSYFRSNSIQRSNVTAAAFQAGLIPNSAASVHSYPLGQPDPVFDPIAGKVAQVDPVRAVTEARAIFNSGEALAAAYSGEYSLVRSVLFNYPLGTKPPPDTPQGLVDVTSEPVLLTAGTKELSTGHVINVGGLLFANMAVDPFVMQYTDGFPLDRVGWGRLSLDALSQETRLLKFVFDIEMLSPYLNTVQSSNAASHVLRAMEQTVYGGSIRGAFGEAGSRTVVVISSDVFVLGLAGLLHTHWQLPGYQPDFCPPGGALVFELRQSNRSKKYLVRVFYTAQTFDQLRNLTPLTREEPPATLQLLIPGGSESATDLDVDFNIFQKLVRKAIDNKYVEDPRKEVPPRVLNDVPLK